MQNLRELAGAIQNDRETLINIIMVVLFILYVWAFYTIILKRDIQKRFLRTFYNAVCSIYAETSKPSHHEATSTYWFEQLNLNYEKLCQTNPNNNYNSILDMLETIIYYYDSYSDIIFKGVFQKEKEPAVRDFAIEMCQYIKNVDPFVSIPQKEADLMHSIADALESNNKSLGTNSLKQLSQEIVAKEKTLVLKTKENQRATIVSVVGLILTILFGLLSIVPK